MAGVAAAVAPALATGLTICQTTARGYSRPRAEINPQPSHSINQSSINHTLKLAHQRSSQIATVQVGMYIHTQYKTIHIYCHVRENKQN